MIPVVGVLFLLVGATGVGIAVGVRLSWERHGALYRRLAAQYEREVCMMANKLSAIPPASPFTSDTEPTPLDYGEVIGRCRPRERP